MLKKAFDEYLYIGTHLQAFCLEMTDGRGSRPDRMQERLLPIAEAFRFAADSLENVTSIKNSPWKCEEQTTTPITTSNSEQPHRTTSHGTSGISANATENPKTTLRPPTLQEATNAALKEHGGISGKMALVDRISAHKEMAKAIFHELTKPGFNASLSFQVLVYLPLEQGATNKHCLPQPNGSSIAGYNEKGVNYFVHSYSAERNIGLAVSWEKISKREADIVDAVFSSESKDLCTTATCVIGSEAFDIEKGGFSSVAVVRCAYEFVWYELGYRYFTIGRTAGVKAFVLSSHNNGKYIRNCGQIFLFP
ncbi:hypothetical protein AAVH_24787 [Aphelenchoides avenae]|nr:hypothetical protein AAVH_24787 [Aphelenchus avenae]